MDQPQASPFPVMEFQLPADIAFRQALANPMVPKMHAGMFTIVKMSAETAIMFGFGGIPNGVVSMPWPLVKTFAGKLLEAVAQYEAAIGQTLVPQDELDGRFNAAASSPESP